jgi:aryl-alcohol dehydrogenase-like predicted oxidoreductase
MTDQAGSERISLGKTDLQISPMGLGTWQWGDRFLWGYGRGYGEADVLAAFEASLSAGINFYDSAEIYGFGRSERLLGEQARNTGEPLVIATKFSPFPWRLWRGRLSAALRGSLKRLGMDRVGLYYIHWPFPPVPIERWVSALADTVDAGLVRAAGVSNFNSAQTRRAHAVLAERGLPLAANQIVYSLIDRKLERQGLLDTCRELGTTVVAYSPLAQGLLTGKYTPENPPRGSRGARASIDFLSDLQALIGLMHEIGQAHGGKTPAQIALNWAICKGTVPIPGAKNLRQAQENAGALGWRLTPDEVAALESASDALTSSNGYD